MTIKLTPIKGIPIVQQGDDLPSIIVSNLKENNIVLKQGDILVITHKIVSIIEGRDHKISEIEISEEALRIARKTGHSPHRVEIALRDSTEILRESPILVTKTMHGLITDFSGVDESNAPYDSVISLPENSDGSALKIHQAISQSFGFPVPIIITDTQGRPWRKGAVNLAIGIAGMNPFTENAGKTDLYGRTLESSLVCIADELAAAAELVMGQSDEGIPAVVISGVEVEIEEGCTYKILRSDRENLFL